MFQRSGSCGSEISLPVGKESVAKSKQSQAQPQPHAEGERDTYKRGGRPQLRLLSSSTSNRALLLNEVLGHSDTGRKGVLAKQGEQGAEPHPAEQG